MRSITLAVFLVACTSSHGTLTSAPQPATQTVRLGDIGLSINTTPEHRTAVSGVLPTNIERAWALLPGAFDSLGIAVTTTDPASFSMGNGGFKARRKLKATSLARYFDCGNSQLGPNAETYELYVSVTTQLRRDAAGTVVTTIAEASGKPITLSGGAVTCQSKTTLEAQLFNALRARLGGA